MPTISNNGSNITYVNDGTTVMPWSNYVISDQQTPANNVIIISFPTSDGTLTDPNAASDGLTISTSNGYTTYTLSDDYSAAEATALLNDLEFTPSNQNSAISYEYLNLTVQEYNNFTMLSASSYQYVDAIGAPTITNTVSNQPTSDTSSIKPFATVDVSDYNYNNNASVTITITDGGVATDADGILTGVGLSKTGTGTYEIALGGYSLQYYLDNLEFTPNSVAANTTKTVNFSLSVTDGPPPGVSAQTTTNTTTSVLVIGPTVTSPPYIGGVPADQSVNTGASITPFEGVTVSDSNSGATDAATLTISGGGTLNGPGLTETSIGVYTLASTSAMNLTDELRTLTYSSTTDTTATIAVDVTDSAGESSSADTTITSSTPTLTPTSTNFYITDVTTGDQYASAGAAYTGPVPNVKNQWLVNDEIAIISQDNLYITAVTPNVFIQTGSGEDAIDVSGVGGDNVLNGGTGSNFLIGGKAGTGFDNFYVDDRNSNAEIWSTIVNFHAGDTATIYGVDKSDFTLTMANNEGATGYTGLTLNETSATTKGALMTLAGFSTSDISSGKLTITYGTTSDGTNYMQITSS